MRTYTFLGTTGLAILTALAVLTLSPGCSSNSTTQPVNQFAPPTNLTVVNGDNEVILRWTATPDAANSDFKGYNVYRNTLSMANATDAQLVNFLLNRNNAYITSTTYTDATAANGTKYFYAVRAVRGSNELSQPTNEFDTAPRREGAQEIDLAEFAYADHASGLNCSIPQAYSMVSSNKQFIDCYLGTLGTTDQANQGLALKSPSRVNNGSPDWASRSADLLLLGSDAAAWDIPVPPTTGWVSQIELGADPVGKVIAVKTPDDGTGKRHYAKLQVLGVRGAAGQREITVLVAYQEIANYPRFSHQ